MKVIVQLILISTVLLSCEAKNETDSTLISSGTSFGECAGYCVRLLEISTEKLLYRASSWNDPFHPTTEYDSKLNAAEWSELLALVDLEVLQSYENVIGCPDCADGGAEWIKVETAEGSMQITFEYGDSLSTIQPLLDQLRIFRAFYEEQLFNK
ncbi:MAG: hypothetical protein HQ508_08965 [Candidatus Marinimicrobia bacterium]|nr:hypothetical protein [Candidatus Neomarinimicrobiota bacterium]